MKKRAVSMFLAALMAASGVLTGIGGGGVRRMPPEPIILRKSRQI